MELEHLKVYEGVVKSANHSEQTYQVRIGDQPIDNCVSAIGFFGALVGIKSTWRIPPGTRVLVVYGPRPYIVGSIPSDVPDPDSHLNRSITHLGVDDVLETIDPASERIPGHSSARDLFDGEFEMGHLQAGFIRFMTFMSAVGGSERSQIQFHILRDLVRVVSGNFEHFSAFGDESIMDDGRVSMEENGTPYPHERMGLLQEGDPLPQSAAEFSGDDFDPLTTGRWRWTRYLGFLGDLFNEWFTDPAETAGKMAEECLRSGKSRIYKGQGGDILFQSVSEIAFERVVRIPVPIRLKHHEDPEGVLRKHFAELDESFLKTWDQDEGRTGHHALFRLRDYGRWLAQYHSLARIHQLIAKGEEFKVPSEDETPAPAIGAGEKDREAANRGNLTYWKECYSTIRIMRDGSQTFQDAWYNHYASGPWGVSVDTPMHYRVTAAGDISMQAGGSIFLGARRHLEAVANRGGLILKGRTFLRALAEKGTLFLNSEYDPDDEYEPDDGDPEAEVDELGYGVVVTSPASGSSLEAGKGLRMEAATAGGEDDSIEVRSRNNLRVEVTGQTDIRMGGKSRLHLSADLFILGGRRILSDLSTILLRRSVRLGYRGIEAVSGLFNNVVSIGGFRGPTDRVFKYDPASPPPPPDLNEDPWEPPDELERGEPSTIRWTFLDASEYSHPGLPGSVGEQEYPEDAGSLFEGAGQQYLRLESPDGYDDWDGGCDPLEGGARIDVTYPYPGENAKWMIDESPTCGPLHAPDSTDPSAMGSLNDGRLASSAMTFRFLKRDQ